MNKIEKALMHGLFVHLHHNIDKAIDFGKFKKLNDRVNKMFPGLMVVGPDANDDAGVVKIPGTNTSIVLKLESHCSPCVATPYDSAATGAGGAIRDVVAMGGKPLAVLDFIGTRPLESKVLVGACGLKGDGKTCTCGKCKTMTSADRVNLMIDGVHDMCDVLGVGIAGGGFSTSFSDIVPALVASVVGVLVTDKPLTKPAKNIGDKIILIGETGNDGNDTAFRAGFADEMRPAKALFGEEKITMDGVLAAFATGKINACSDLGAAGIGAATCESARYGGLGAKVDLSVVPLNAEASDNTPEATLINETQARFLLQVNPGDVDKVLAAIRSKKAKATIIGEITNDDKVVFTYGGKTIASIPNKPSAKVLAELKK
ncbi:AIR synthase-related protein [Candidatus Saccharibacteria bacterium]|nr:AIR synthase-related protein [Candidatus Saccharibacteria bacterium]